MSSPFMFREIPLRPDLRHRCALRACCLILLTVGGLPACDSTYPQAPTSKLLDEEVVLGRDKDRAFAAREIEVDGPSSIVAIVDERGSDVELRIRLANGGATLAPGTAVETHLEGEGIEIAHLAVRHAAKVVIELVGSRYSSKVRRVRVEVLQFRAAAKADASTAARLAGYSQWALGTRVGVAQERVAAECLPHIDRAIAIFESGPSLDARLAAMARLVRARTFYFHELSQPEARNEARRAASAFASSRVADTLNAARARRLEAAALQEISLDPTSRDPSAAEADLESRLVLRELTAQESALDDVGRARAINLRALAELYTGQWSAARALFDQAVHYYDAADYRAGSMQSKRNLALLANLRGDLTLAARLYEARLEDLQWMDDPDMRTSLLHNAALAASNVGDSDSAIARFLQAEKIARAGRLPHGEARALHNLGLEYYARGDLAQASALLMRALELRRKAGAGPGLYASLRAVGSLQRNRNELREALASHRAAEERAPNVVSRLRALVDIALDEAAAQRNTAAIAYLRQALDLKLQNPRHPAVAEAQLALADLLLGQSRGRATLDEARHLALAALAVARQPKDIPIEINALRILARTQVAGGDRRRAQVQLEKAIDLALRYRRFSSSLELQASSLASQQQIFCDYIGLLMDGVPHRQNPHAATPAEIRALRALETVRALMFGAQRRAGASSGELDAALATLAAKRESVTSLLELARPPEAEIRALQLDAARLRAEIDHMRALHLAGANQDVLDIDRPAGVWQPLQAGHAQISYFLADEKAYAWERSTRGIRVWTLAAHPGEFERQVGELVNADQLQDVEEYDRRLLALSDLLMPKGLAGGDVTSLDVVADGDLARVPFAGLRSPNDPSRRLIETHVVTTIASLFQTPAPASAARSWDLVTVADSASSTSPASADVEIRTVAATISAAQPRVLSLQGATADAGALEKVLRDGVGILHFATHGVADPQQPLASRLSLHGQNGYLTAGQIQEWRGDAGLVFLSACDSAVGLARFGDSMPGLQRAFLRAGARDVIATLWTIEDRLAAQFARDFYRLLVTGMPPAEALARTQRAWLLSANGESQQILMRRRVGAWAYAIYSR
jgi:CHAT domain-containing protein/tetratricopeptide (TPR) repeat protein